MSRFKRDASAARRRDASVADGVGSSPGRAIRFMLSDESVARDGCVIKTAGWDLTAYRLNPVVCNNHDTNSPPIAKCIEIGPVGTRLFGTAQFATVDEYRLGDTVFKLLKGGYLSAASVSWLPLESRYATGKDRAPGSIDFIRQELLEWSVVTVPCLTTALVTARAAGIDLKPLARSYEQALDSGRLPASRQEIEAARRAIVGDAPSYGRGWRAEAIAEAEQLRIRVAAEDAAARAAPGPATREERVAHARLLQRGFTSEEANAEIALRRLVWG